MIRTGIPDDIPALLAIENACFIGDRLTRRNFQHLLSDGHALTLLDEKDGLLRGYIMVLFRESTSIARIYSIATHPEFLGQGIAAALVLAAERAALDRCNVLMRLEIRKDNQASQRLFQSRGYKVFDEYDDYYEDGEDALRLEKSLTRHLRPQPARVPYYRQTLGFTCGPSCLMMAMKAFAPPLRLDRTLELQLWREATTIFMTAGHGGCGPHGLALAASRRGYPCEIYVSGHGILFQDSVRNPEKRAVIQLVQDDFTQQASQAGIPVRYRAAGAHELSRCLKDGGIPLVLISAYRITGERSPHWVVVTGCDDHYFYIHDPDTSGGRTHDDCIDMAIPTKDFERMARYGKAGVKAVVTIYPPKENICPQTY
jgi:ribosomal protein S18 acetylase RimI-like enzyme